MNAPLGDINTGNAYYYLAQHDIKSIYQQLKIFYRPYKSYKAGLV